MDRKTQDLAWSILPKEFREEVKYEYSRVATKAIKSSYDLGFMNAHEGMYGIHNLASDAEGEEMLTISRKQVQEMYAHYDKISNDPNRPKDHIESVYEYADGITIALDNLFGSKCLPDACNVASNVTSNVASNEPKPAEPKFKVGDCVLVTQKIGDKEKAKIVYYDSSDNSYRVEFENEKAIGSLWFDESDLEPYTEPTANYLRSEGALNTAVLAGNYSSASTCDKQFDNIIKDGFKNHNRLHIAAMAMAGLLANTNNNADISEIVADALQCADTLIAECEKGGPK